MPPGSLRVRRPRKGNRPVERVRCSIRVALALLLAEEGQVLRDRQGRVEVLAEA
jgi:hypothetical protein